MATFASNWKSSAQHHTAALYFFNCKKDAQFHRQLEDFLSHPESLGRQHWRPEWLLSSHKWSFRLLSIIYLSNCLFYHTSIYLPICLSSNSSASLPLPSLPPFSSLSLCLSCHCLAIPFPEVGFRANITTPQSLINQTSTGSSARLLWDSYAFWIKIRLNPLAESFTTFLLFSLLPGWSIYVMPGGTAAILQPCGQKYETGSRQDRSGLMGTEKKKKKNTRGPW